MPATIAVPELGAISVPSVRTVVVLPTARTWHTKNMTTYDERLPRGNCQQNARIMTAMYPELTQAEGYLVLAGPDGTEFRIEHSWNETPDGQIVDSTAWAREGTGTYRYERDPQAWARFAGSVDSLRRDREAGR
jgi:hypothetical protein